MAGDRELRDAILGLVKLCKLYQARALSLNTGLTVLMQLPPTKKAALRPAQIEEETQKARAQAMEIGNDISAELEQALAGDRDFLHLLKLYIGNPKHQT